MAAQTGISVGVGAAPRGCPNRNIGNSETDCWQGMCMRVNNVENLWITSDVKR